MTYNEVTEKIENAKVEPMPEGFVPDGETPENVETSTPEPTLEEIATAKKNAAAAAVEAAKEAKAAAAAARKAAAAARKEERERAKVEREEKRNSIIEARKPIDAKISEALAQIKFLKAKVTVLRDKRKDLGPLPGGGGTGGGGGVSRYAGKTIVATFRDESGELANPRREGTYGAKSFALILDAGGEIPYSEYKELGGRTKDLRWDLNRGFASLSDVGDDGNDGDDVGE